MLSDCLDLVALPLVFRHQFWITVLVINILILLDIYSAGYKILTSKAKRMKSSVKAYFYPLIFKNLVMWSMLLHLSEEVDCNWSLFSCHISLRGVSLHPLEKSVWPDRDSTCSEPGCDTGQVLSLWMGRSLCGQCRWEPIQRTWEADSPL